MFFLHLLIFTILPSLSTGVYTYGIIRNASIQLPFALPNDSSHQLRVNDCEDCLCEAYRRGENVYLFTCARLPPGFLCEFYYFMPKRDEIVYPSNDTTIYLIKNETFEEKADCCNTTYLLEQLRNASLQGPLISNSTRFLVFDDSHNIIATVKGEGMYGFNRSDLTNLNLPLIGSSPRTIGYYDGKYYFSEGTNIEVYNATPFSSLYNITLSLGDLTAIRFLNATQMLVGVGNRNTGVYIFKKASTTDQFQSSTSKKISGTDGGETHAIGILNENAFYLGWYTNNPTIALFMRAENNTWYRNNTFNTNHGALTSDIFVDQCQRIWAANPHGSRLFIFDQNGKNLGNVTIGTGLFGLVILEEQNYTLITSHTDSSTPDTNGIYHTHPSVNCQNRENPFIKLVNSCDRSYLSATCDYPIENNDWRPKQDLLVTRFEEVNYSESFRTINQDYGSFYHQSSPSTCTPDILREKVLKRHEHYFDCLLEQAPCYPWKNHWQTNIYPQCHTQTITLVCHIDLSSAPIELFRITHRKKFSSCNENDMTIEFLIGQIRQRLKGSIDSNTCNTARMLIAEYLVQQPSASVADVINGVIEKLK